MNCRRCSVVWAWRWFRPPRASCPTARRVRPVPAAKCCSSFNSCLERLKSQGFIMSRVAKMPVDLPQGVTATIGAQAVTLKGAKGSLTLPLKQGVKVVQQEKHLEVQADTSAEGMNAVAGATRAHLANMVLGVTKGYEKKLELVGVG